MDWAGLCDERLLACAGMVRPGVAVADVGTDHGYLACHLVGSGRCPRAVATDLREKPLARAAAQIRACGLEDRIETRLCDGLDGLPLGVGEGRIEQVVVAGMGGELIAEIIRARPEAKDSRLRFVLQPMTRPEALRRALCEMGFELLEERGVRENGFVYTVMAVRYAGDSDAVGPNELFCWTGLLPRSDHPDSAEMLRATLRRLRERADGMRRSRRDRDGAARWSALAAEVERILEQMGGQDTR